MPYYWIGILIWNMGVSKLSKVKVNLIKGPKFDLVEKKAYGLLHTILVEKGIEERSVKKDKAE